MKNRLTLDISHPLPLEERFPRGSQAYGGSWRCPRVPLKASALTDKVLFLQWVRKGSEGRGKRKK